MHDRAMGTDVLERSMRRMEIKENSGIKAVNEHFNSFGNELQMLKSMVRRLFPKENVPKSKTKCRKLLKGVYVNIYDYVQEVVKQNNLKHVYYIEDNDNARRLFRKRLKARGTYPLEQAKSDDLRGLLKTIFFHN
eukprot:m.340963 g.340963  ORF g.340963 m.340963 type:complete len:135 (-) comp19659_c0_seq1:105-509(-)